MDIYVHLSLHPGSSNKHEHDNPTKPYASRTLPFAATPSTYLGEMVLQFLLSITCLCNALSQSNVRRLLLFHHVVGGRLEDTVDDGTKRDAVLTLLLGVQDVDVGEVLPLVGRRRTEE